MKQTATKIRLGDLVTFVSGGTPSKQVASYWGGETPWVSAKDLKSLRIGSSIDTLSPEGTTVASLVPKDTLLLLVRGMTLFKNIPLGITTRELAINQDLKGLIAKKGVLPEFIMYSLLSRKEELIQMVEAAGHGTGRLDTNTLKDILIFVLPMRQQKLIIETIEIWGSFIEKTIQLIAAKERKYLYELSRLINTADHIRTNIGEFANEVSERNRQDIVRVLSVTNSRGFVLPEDQFERRIASADLSNYKIVRRGQYAYNPSRINVGSISRLDDWDTGVLSPMYVVFSLDNKRINSNYFTHWLASNEAHQRIKNSAQGSVRETVSFSEFATIPFPLPEKKKQAVIASYLNSLREEIILLQNRNAKLRQQKNGLMQKLLTGEWQVPDIQGAIE